MYCVIRNEILLVKSTVMHVKMGSVNNDVLCLHKLSWKGMSKIQIKILFEIQKKKKKKNKISPTNSIIATSATNC